MCIVSRVPLRARRVADLPPPRVLQAQVPHRLVTARGAGCLGTYFARYFYSSLRMLCGAPCAVPWDSREGCCVSAPIAFVKYTPAHLVNTRKQGCILVHVREFARSLALQDIPLALALTRCVTSESPSCPQRPWLYGCCLHPCVAGLTAVHMWRSACTPKRCSISQSLVFILAV